MSAATPGLAHVASDLAGVLDSELPPLNRIGEERAGEPISAGKWSRKQVLGHLIDSAANNHQRFVRGQLGPALVLPGYEQEKWVAAQGYQDRSWSELLGLWTALNRHLVHVLARVDPASVETPCTIGTGPAVTLRFLAEDYVRHLRHHLEQVLSPAAAAGKTHPPH